MPIAAISAPLATLFAGGAAAGATAYGVHSSGKSAQRAGEISARSNADALAYQREQDAIQKQQFEAQQAESKRQWNIQQANLQLQQQKADEDRMRAMALQDAREARAAPYRQASQAALLRMGDLLKQGAATPGISAFQRPSATTIPMGALMRRG